MPENSITHVNSRSSALSDECLATASWIATAVIAAFLAIGQIVAMGSLLAHKAGFAFVAPVSLLAALSLGYWLAVREGFNSRMRWYPPALVLCLLGVALLLSAFYYDFSFDGQDYHQAAILNIAHGWNPLADPMHTFPSNFKLWVRHYSKGPWYLQAAIYVTTGHIELGKCLNWLALAAMFLAVAAACIDLGLRRGRAIGIAALVAMNPVVVSELATFMVDAIMTSFLVVAAASIFSGLRRPGLTIVLTGVAAAIVAINAKFTGLVFLCFILAGAGLWCLFRQRERLLPFSGLSLAAILLGACVWGYNPYVTNTIYMHQPFYPVLSSAKYPSLTAQGKEGIELYETPKNMMGRSWLVRFGYSIFGRPGNQPYLIGKDATLMWPFAAHPADLYAYNYHETRVAGFGPWFSGCLLLSFFFGLWLLIQRWQLRWSILLPSAVIVASLLISIHLWWPRYGPQLWLLPIVPLAVAFGAERSKLQMRASWFLSVLLFANAIIVAAVHFHWETTATLALRGQLHDLRQSGEEYEFNTNYFQAAMNERLAEAGVRFQDLGRLKTFPNSRELLSMVQGYHFPIQYRPASGDTPTSARTIKSP